MAAGRIALVIALTLERPTCLDCIARTGAMTVDDVDVAFQTIGTVLELHTDSARCSVCGRTTRVLAVRRPPNATA